MIDGVVVIGFGLHLLGLYALTNQERVSHRRGDGGGSPWADLGLCFWLDELVALGGCGPATTAGGRTVGMEWSDLALVYCSCSGLPLPASWLIDGGLAPSGPAPVAGPTIWELVGGLWAADFSMMCYFS